jgi:hypothetical protein
MKIDPNVSSNLISQEQTDTTAKSQTVSTFQQLDVIDPQTAEQQKEQELLAEATARQGLQGAAPPAQEDSGFDYTSLIPFGIGNWFDGEGCFASDLGKTVLSIACPIPFVGGLLADWGGDWLGNAIVNTADWIGDTVSDAASWIGGAVSDAAGAVGGAVEDAAGAVEDAAGAVAGAVEDAAGAVADAVSDALDW